MTNGAMITGISLRHWYIESHPLDVPRKVMLQLAGAKDKAVLALAFAKRPQKCQRLHCVLIVKGI